VVVNALTVESLTTMIAVLIDLRKKEEIVTGENPLALESCYFCVHAV